MPTTTRTPRERKINAALWTVQLLLAALFLFAGGMKLVVPPEMLKGPIDLPLAFIRFIGVCEVAGGLGMILPGLLRIRTGLTPLAAAGLVIIMIGAVSTTLIGGMGVGAAVVPFVTGLLAAAVAYGRRYRVPLNSTPRRRLALQPAA